ncbi:aspartate/methionine/tyrosine aminotransferase [Rhodococcus sp. 27YEA15]|uniref:ferritin-like domain-containing protein n=1 Tax=Rhodococcus sp. 27YEA15 TaxID=3156259 RepID=UPI003C7A5869
MNRLRSSTSADSALVAAVETENAAIFAYGVVAAFSNPARVDEVATYTAAHRARRDALVETAARTGVSVPPAAAAYSIPFAVVDAVTAAQLAAQIESDTAVTYRAFVEQVDDDDLRAFGVEGLTDAATRGAKWRAALGNSPATTAFPGDPNM